jgi:hypothetical protein
VSQSLLFLVDTGANNIKSHCSRQRLFIKFKIIRVEYQYCSLENLSNNYDLARHMPASALYSTDFPTLQLWRRGKVRDVYDLGTTLLFVATDRISAYDVIMDQPIPGKGVILTSLSLFWFRQLADIVPNHLITADVDSFPP